MSLSQTPCLKAEPAADRPDVRAPRVRIVRRAVHGVLLLDKPVGLSSNDALQKAKWLLRAEKAGHTGTLDPMASGLLPICFGAATKFSQISLDADKAYEAQVLLGVTTTTGDAEGEVLQRCEVRVGDDEVGVALRRLTGEIEQVPPMHSALKKDGKPLYAYAREGIEVERAARRVVIHDLQGVRDPQDQSRLTLRVRCSKGTYIRTLAEDIGRLLGCGASLTALRRTGSGGLTLERAWTIEELEALPDERRLEALMPVDTLLSQWPSMMLPQEDAAKFLTGLRRRLPIRASSAEGVTNLNTAPAAGPVRVYGPSAGQPVLLGSAHVTGGELIPDRLLSPPEINALLAATGG